MFLPKDKRIKYPLLITLLLAVVGSIVYFLFFRPWSIEAIWFDDSWLYRQKIEITNSSTAQTDFQVMVTADTSTLITAGKMQSDCDDIRVTDISGKLLPYWLEPNTCSTASTLIWTKVPSIPASNATIYLYYGNPSVTSDSSTANTFIREITGVQGAWNMDEASWNNNCSADTVLDASGNSNHGKACPATTGPDGGDAGQFGNGGDFDGSNDRITAIPAVTSTPLVLSVWFKVSSGVGTWATTVLAEICMGSPVDFGEYHRIYMTTQTANSTWTVVAQTRDSAGESSASSAPFTGDFNKWYQLIGVFRSATDREIFLDGVSKATNTTSRTPSGLNSLNIGAWAGWGGYSCYFNGTLDNVRIYNQALTSTEISDLYGTGGDRQGYVTTNYPNKELVRKYSSSVSVGSPASEEKAPGPVAYWSFDSGYGTVAQDKTENNNDGAISGATWQTEDMCISGKCLKFDGTDDVVTVTNASAIDLNDQLASAFTFQTWVRVNSDGENSVGEIFDKGTDTYLRITNEGTDGYADLEAKIDLASSPATKTITNGITLNRWHHLALTYTDDSDDEITIFIDGQNKGSSTDGSGAPNTDANNLLIGGSDAANFHGFIDEFKIYKTERSLAQIRTDYLRGSAMHGSSAVLGQRDSAFLNDGLVGYWNMDESSWTNDCSTDTVLDSSGNANHGDSCPSGSGPTGGDAGKFGNGGGFDGTNDYVNVAGIINDLNLNQGTMSTWVYIGDLEYLWFLVAGDGTANNELGIYHSWGTVYFRYEVGGTIRESSGAMGEDMWYHLVGVWHSDNSIQLFINGVPQTANSRTADITSVSQAVLGARSTVPGNPHKGLLDEVRIYNRALTPSEVEGLYNWAPGPVAHWKMDEKVSGDSQTIYDSSTYGNNGTTNDGANNTGMDCTTPGKYGGGCKFDGVDDYVDCGDIDAIDGVSALTISAWVRTDALGTYDGVFAKAYGDNRDIGMMTSWDGQEDEVLVVLRNGVANGYGRTIGANLLSVGAWHFWTMVFDGSGATDADRLKFYLDGIQQTLSVGTITTTTPATTAVAKIGSGLNGLVDDVRIYNYARSAKQIMEDLNAGHPAVGSPVGSALTHWKFDEGYGTTAQDSSNNNKDLTLSSASWTNSGKFGKAFDGGDNKRVADGADDNDLDFGATEDFSLSAWVKYSATNPTATEYILHKQTGNEGYALYMDTDGDLIFGIGDTSSASFPEDTAGNIARDYADNTWHHLVGVKTSNSKIEMYVDGNLIGSDTSLAADATLENSAILYIGDANATDGTDEFLGDIDEVKIYNFVLTPSEIRQDFLRGAAALLGATGTDSSGNPSWSSERSYCPPGDTTASCSPVAEWKMDEASWSGNGAVKDTSANSNHMTHKNNVAITISGKYGRAGIFDGTGDYLCSDANTDGTCDDDGDFDFGTSSFTIGGWFKHNTISSNPDYMVVKAQAGTNAGYKIYMASDGDIVFEIDDDSTWNPDDSVTTTAATYDDNNWHHFSAVKNSTSAIYIYIDGIQIASDITIAASNTLSNDDVFYIGIDDDAASNGFEGLLDNIRVFNYALSQAQIAWEYNRGRPIAHWKFDECQGGTVYDWEGSNDGTITIGSLGSQTSLGTCAAVNAASAWYNGRNGKWNYSLSFDGTDDYVSVSDNDSLSFTYALEHDQPFSVSAWVYMHDITGEQGIVAKYGASGSQEWILKIDQFTRLAFGCFTSDGWGWRGRLLGLTIGRHRDQWLHVVGTYDGTAEWGTCEGFEIYINGVASSTTNYDSGNYTGMSNTSQNVEIGTYNTTNNFDGLIDDVRIYNYALTEQQIRDVYNQGAAVRFGPETGAP